LEEAIALLENLVRLPSPSGQEQEAATFLADWLAAHGFEAGIDEVGNAVGVRGDGPGELLLLGHIDTFPGELPLRREGDTLHGRGTVDAKGPLCAFAVAASRLRVADGWRVAVVGAVEEEAATSKGARHILTRRKPSFCVIGEPGGWERLTLGYKGRLLVDYHYHGPLAHTAGPNLLPAEQAVAFWNAVAAYAADFNRGREKAFQRLDASLCSIVTADEGSYGSVEMSLALRLPPGLSPEELAAELLALDEEGSGPARPSFYGAEAAFLAGKNNDLVRAFLAAIRERGGQPRFVLKTGTSDMNVVGPVWGCPIVAYGPGDSSLDHTPEEHIDLREYIRAIEVLESSLVSIPEF
jgi:LysW-gamma-L-lysine carboxypeptidase